MAAGLGTHHRDVDVMAGVGRGLDADALVDAVFAQVGAPRPGRDHDVHLHAAGRDAQLVVTQPDERAQVAALEAVLAHDGLLGLFQRGGVERHLHLEDLGGVEQAPGVLGQAEDGGAQLGVVGAHALEDAQPVVQAVAEHVDLRIPPVDELAIEPDLPITIRH